MYFKLSVTFMIGYLLIGNLNAQNIQLLLSPNPSPYISDWQNRTETATLIISNPGSSDIPVKVKTELFDGKNSVVANTVASKMPVLIVPPGVSQYNAEDIFPISAIDYNGSLEMKTAQTGRIPDDNYRFCVSLTDPQTGAPIGSSGPVCKNFNIIAYQAPVLVTPTDNERILESGIHGIVFRWTPVSPSPRGIVTYRLQVFEVLPGQENITALRSNQPIVEKDLKGILQTQWPIDFALPEVGKTYIWTITPLDAEDGKLVDGYGFAEPFVFEVSDGFLRTETNQSGTVVVGDKIKAGENGEFEVEVMDISTEADGTLTGTGKVVINWLLAPVKVEFKNITIDQDKYLINGGIIAMQGGASGTSPLDYPKAWVLSVLSGPLGSNAVDGIINWTNNKIENLVNGYVNNTLGFNQPMMLYKSNIPPPSIPDNSLKMPFGLSFPIHGNSQKLLITEIIFKPNESKLNFIVSSGFQHSGSTYQLGFVGKYLPIHPSNIDFGNGRIELAEDFTMPSLSSDPKMEFLFKKGISNGGCYLEWSENGLDDIRLEMEVTFSRDWLIPIPSPLTTSKVKCLLTGNALSMQDFMFTGNLPQCEIVGTNGLKMQVGSITLDFSDVQNPSTLAFPTNYPHSSTDLTWQGFYMKNFTITLPETWKTGNNQQPPNISAASLIIDDMGLTTEILATNIYDLVSGRVADLSASLDTVKISILNSSLTNGRAAGRIVLPVSEVSASNTLKYKALFSQSGGSGTFQFVIVPTGDISAEILKAKITLNSTSNITANLTTGSISCSMTLNGTLKWNDPNLIPSVTGNLGSLGAPLASGLNGVKMELSFENLKLTYTRNTITDENTMTFNQGSWSFASPQKWVANLPVTIDRIYYLSLPTINPQGGKQLLRGAIMLDIVANLTDEIGGKTSIGAAFGIDFYTSPLRLKPVFAGVVIKNVEVHADLSAVKIDGFLALRSGDPIFGDGFMAEIEVTFTAVSFKCRALTEFGTTNYQNPTGQIYRYWRVEADVILPVGIPFLTGVGFYGFGGGAFYNMNPDPIQSIKNPGNTVYTFKPKKSALGFMVKATIGTMPKFETFNADVSLLAAFSTSSGITQISFLGNFWLTASLEERDSAKIMGSVIVDYNFPSKIFFLAAGLKINIPPAIITPKPEGVGLVMNIDGRANKWYFIAGRPSNTNVVRVFGIDLYSYFMFGNDIPTPNGFTQRFTNNYQSATGYYPNSSNVGNGGVGENTINGKGIATGVGIEFTKSISQDLINGGCRRWSIDGTILAGAELNLSLMHQTGCIGINGYRASGNLGLYASAYTTIHGEGRRGCRDRDHNLFKIQAGAWVEGKFPNPEYITGSITANISLFNGLCECTYYGTFQKGTNCSGTETITTNAAQEDEADSLRNALIQYISPTSHYNFPIASTINVKYSLVPDKVFDVAENQGDGTILNRTFKLVTTRSLEVKNAGGTWSLLTLQSKVNGIGEYQCFIKPTISGVVIPDATQTVDMGLSLNTNTGNSLVSSAGTINLNAIYGSVPPPPVPSYPNPSPIPVNNLVANMDYRFTVTATLYELKTTVPAGYGSPGGPPLQSIWSPALTRNNLPVKETKVHYFRTGAMAPVQLSTGVSGSKI